ncbi:MAG: 2-oxo acid dehydrogenase subunit E2 [Mogibacterium sp.]|nr:2-oxo acid dehydrogenase subunit E2 [Mogibacterium sp.]
MSYFDISRKIIASITTDSWRNVPHLVYIYEADAEKLMEAVRSYNSSHPKEERISVNSAVLKVIIEGIKAGPALNGHVFYDHALVRGRIELSDHIDISTPVLYKDGKMMTVNLHRMEDRSMREIQEVMNDCRKRLDNTDMEALLYLTGLADTFDGLMHGKVLKAAGRLIGAKVGKGRIKVSAKRMRECIRKGKAGEGLATEDIRQGSITISNVGSVGRHMKGSTLMLEVVPPQICAMAVGTLQKKPAAEDDRVVIKEIIPITIAIDHRAVDYADMIPFLERMEELLSNEELIEAMI